MPMSNTEKQDTIDSVYSGLSDAADVALMGKAFFSKSDAVSERVIHAFQATIQALGNIVTPKIDYVSAGDRFAERFRGQQKDWYIEQDEKAKRDIAILKQQKKDEDEAFKVGSDLRELRKKMYDLQMSDDTAVRDRFFAKYPGVTAGAWMESMERMRSDKKFLSAMEKSGWFNFMDSGKSQEESRLQLTKLGLETNWEVHGGTAPTEEDENPLRHETVITQPGSFMDKLYKIRAQIYKAQMSEDTEVRDTYFGVDSTIDVSSWIVQAKIRPEDALSFLEMMKESGDFVFMDPGKDPLDSRVKLSSKGIENHWGRFGGPAPVAGAVDPLRHETAAPEPTAGTRGAQSGDLYRFMYEHTDEGVGYVGVGAVALAFGMSRPKAREILDEHGLKDDDDDGQRYRFKDGEVSQGIKTVNMLMAEVSGGDIEWLQDPLEYATMNPYASAGGYDKNYKEPLRKNSGSLDTISDQRKGPSTEKVVASNRDRIESIERELGPRPGELDQYARQEYDNKVLRMKHFNVDAKGTDIRGTNAAFGDRAINAEVKGAELKSLTEKAIRSLSRESGGRIQIDLMYEHKKTGKQKGYSYGAAKVDRIKYDNIINLSVSVVNRVGGYDQVEDSVTLKRTPGGYNNTDAGSRVRMDSEGMKHDLNVWVRVGAKTTIFMHGKKGAPDSVRYDVPTESLPIDFLHGATVSLTEKKRRIPGRNFSSISYTGVLPMPAEMLDIARRLSKGESAEYIDRSINPRVDEGGVLDPYDLEQEPEYVRKERATDTGNFSRR